MNHHLNVYKLYPRGSDPRRKTTTRTIRIAQRYDEVLKEESERRGLSFNALMDRILQRYVEAQRFFEGQMAVTLLDQTFQEILDGIDETHIRELALDAGSTRPQDRLRIRGIPLDHDSLVWFIKQVLGEYNGWFRCDIHQRKGREMPHLRHKFESMWSAFIENYVASMFREILDYEPKVESLDNAVTIYLNERTA